LFLVFPFSDDLYTGYGQVVCKSVFI